MKLPKKPTKKKLKDIMVADLIAFEQANRPLQPDAFQTIFFKLKNAGTFAALRHIDIMSRIYKYNFLKSYETTTLQQPTK